MLALNKTTPGRVSYRALPTTDAEHDRERSSQEWKDKRETGEERMRLLQEKRGSIAAAIKALEG